MKKTQFTLVATLVIAGLALSGCTKTEAKTGSATLIVTGNVHSQLDPCG
jgi:outer membrane murein-binding lipoprotein Lpp